MLEVIILLVDIVKEIVILLVIVYFLLDVQFLLFQVIVLNADIQKKS